jgi:hypothetical protein
MPMAMKTRAPRIPNPVGKIVCRQCSYSRVGRSRQLTSAWADHTDQTGHTDIGTVELSTMERALEDLRPAVLEAYMGGIPEAVIASRMGCDLLVVVELIARSSLKSLVTAARKAAVRSVGPPRRSHQDPTEQVGHPGAEWRGHQPEGLGSDG